MSRRFVLHAGLFAGLYYVALSLFDGTIFVISHLPTAVLRLDGLILALTGVGRVLVFPRWVLQHSLLGEWMPYSLNWIFGLLNCLIWGCLFAAVKAWRERIR